MVTFWGRVLEANLSLKFGLCTLYQIHQKILAWVRPSPPFWQCQDFGSTYSCNLSLIHREIGGLAERWGECWTRYLGLVFLLRDDSMDHFGWIFGKLPSIPKCIYPKSNFAKCTRLVCLLSFASLFFSGMSSLSTWPTYLINHPDLPTWPTCPIYLYVLSTYLTYLPN